MIGTTLVAMTTAEAIVASAFMMAVTAVVLLIIWQLFALARRGMDHRADQPRHHVADDRDQKAGRRGDND